MRKFKTLSLMLVVIMLVSNFASAADYQVVGNSMSGIFEDGDIVEVTEQNSYSEGDNVVFQLYGQKYIKQLQGDRLVGTSGMSFNKNHVDSILGIATYSNRDFTDEERQAFEKVFAVGVEEISAGEAYSMARLTDGTVWAWGMNTSGQLGNGTTNASNIPVQVSGIITAVEISAGGAHGMARLSGGAIMAWGLNANGRLGNNDTTNSNVPVEVIGITTAVEISASGHSMARLLDNTVLAWGQNNFGQIGDGTKTDRHIPVVVSGITTAEVDVEEISAGYLSSMARLSDSTVMTWGSNESGLLGIGVTGGDRTTPVQVVDEAGTGVLGNVVEIAPSMARLANGTVWTWGSNGSGQLGNGTTIASNKPVQVSNIITAVEISTSITGATHRMARLSDGAIVAWGNNGNGRLGDNSTTNRETPVQVLGVDGIGYLEDVVEIVVGGAHSMARLSGGAIMAWGNNGSGRIGDGTTTHRFTPVAVTAIIPPVVDITEATVTIAAPVLGADPQNAAAVETATSHADYTVTSLVWVEALTADGKFKAAETYTATVTLTSKNSKKFQDAAFTPTVAGSESVGTTTTAGGDVVGNTVSFTITYAATGALAVTGIAVTTQPTKMDYIETTDATLALNGMVVTATNNDGSTTVVTFADGTAADYTADYTAAPENGTNLTIATHNNQPVVITHTASTQTTNTGNLVVADPRAWNNINWGANITASLGETALPDDTLILSGTGLMNDFPTIEWSQEATHVRGLFNAGIRHILIGEGITSIGSSAFIGQQLTSVIIPNSVTSIGNFAFNTNGLTSVSIPNSVTQLSNAFAHNQLTSLIIPNSVTSIANFAFHGNQLTSITMERDDTTIGISILASENNMFRDAYLAGQSGVYVGTQTGAWTRVVDKDELNNAITSAETKITEATVGEAAGNYPQTAVDALTTAIQAAQAVADNQAATQAEIDAAKEALDQAITTFEAAVITEAPVNKTALTESITNAQTKVDDATVGEEAGNYPQTAVDALSTAIQAAQAVIDNPEATQAEIDAAKEAIDQAITTFEAAVITETVGVTYSIIFNSAGGSDVDPITQAAGTVIVAPPNPTKAGFSFTGWTPVLPGTMPAESVTLTAQWTAEPTGNLGGAITDGDGALAGVEVRLMKGGTNGTQYGTTVITDGNGTFSFTALPYGIYSLVGTKVVAEVSKTITKAIVIEAPNTTENMVMPTGDQQTFVEVVGNDTPSVAVSNLEDMFTADDLLIIAGVGEVTITLVVEQKAQGDVVAQSSLIQGALQSGKVVGVYFDIKIRRTVTGTVDNNVNDQLVQPPAGEKVRITVDVPVALRNKAPYQVIRVHDGIAAVLPATYNSTLHTLTFEADLFSVYSIVYTNVMSGSSDSDESISTVTIERDPTKDIIEEGKIKPHVVIDKNLSNELEITLKETVREVFETDAKGTDLIIPIIKDTENITVNLNGRTVKLLADNETSIVIKANRGSTSIKASDINLADFKDEAGKPIAPEDITVSIILKSSSLTDHQLKDLGKELGVEIVKALGTVDVVLKSGQTVVNVEKFNHYVTQRVDLPNGLDESKISTAVFIDKTGAMNHTPTEICFVDGQYYIIVKSFYPGLNYYLISNPVNMQQVVNHWSKNAVNDMASRLVIFNQETFIPDKAITRADFAEYIVRAIGIYREDITIKNKFTDVGSSNKRALAIAFANQYGIISGYPDGSFRPGQQITREEAMTMYARAMDTAGLSQVSGSHLSRFRDSSQISDWALPYVNQTVGAGVFRGRTADTIDSKGIFTYSEAATAIRNLLSRVVLMDAEGCTALSSPVNEAPLLQSTQEPTVEQPVVETPPASSEDAPAASDNRTHLVVPGDTLYSLSLYYYGHGSHYTHIMSHNGLKSPADMQAGMTLVIPPL